MTGTPAEPGGDADRVERVGKGTKRFVVAFLAVFVVCGLGSVELWPLTGWRLYSALRTEERSSWQLRAVDADGDEQPIVLGDLPLGYRNTTSILDEFPSLTADERDEVCDAWAAALDDSERVVGVHVYRVRKTVVDGSVVDRRLEYTCGAGS